MTSLKWNDVNDTSPASPEHREQIFLNSFLHAKIQNIPCETCRVITLFVLFYPDDDNEVNTEMTVLSAANLT